METDSHSLINNQDQDSCKNMKVPQKDLEKLGLFMKTKLLQLESPYLKYDKQCKSDA